MMSAKSGGGVWVGWLAKSWQKLTRRGGGFCQKLMSANYQISMTKTMTFAPLVPFLPFMKGPLNSPTFSKVIFFPIFICHIEPTCQKICFYDQNCDFPLYLRTYVSINPCWKADVSQGGRGVFFVKSWQKLTRGGRGQNWPNFGWRHLWTIPYYFCMHSFT